MKEIPQGRATQSHCGAQRPAAGNNKPEHSTRLPLPQSPSCDWHSPVHLAAQHRARDPLPTRRVDSSHIRLEFVTTMLARSLHPGPVLQISPEAPDQTLITATRMMAHAFQ